MADVIPPSRQALAEAHGLSAEILRNIELSEIALSSIALKTSRLARLLNDFDFQYIFELEASGYPSTPNGIDADTWRLAKLASRVYSEETTKDKEEKIVERAYVDSIATLENTVNLSEAALAAARDPDVSVASANPHQFVGAGIGNTLERREIKKSVALASTRLAARRALLYQYVVRRHYELKFSGIADDIFSRMRERLDSSIGDAVPTAVQKLTAIYDNLRSENPEDWSNAVHSCRRMLQELADALYPATEDRNIEVDGKKRLIKMGPDNYVNRLMAFIEEHSTSEQFNSIVGSHLRFIGERLDGVVQATQKGSHTTIADRNEADRYVIYTYLIAGDILSLKSEPPPPTPPSPS